MTHVMINNGSPVLSRSVLSPTLNVSLSWQERVWELSGTFFVFVPTTSLFVSPSSLQSSPSARRMVDLFWPPVAVGYRARGPQRLHIENMAQTRSDCGTRTHIPNQQCINCAHIRDVSSKIKRVTLPTCDASTMDACPKKQNNLSVCMQKTSPKAQIRQCF